MQYLQILWATCWYNLSLLLHPVFMMDSWTREWLSGFTIINHLMVLRAYLPPADLSTEVQILTGFFIIFITFFVEYSRISSTYLKHLQHACSSSCCTFWQKQSLPYLCAPWVSLALAGFPLFSSLNSFSRVSDTPALRQRQKHISGDGKQGKKDCPFWEQLHLLINILTEFHYIAQVLGIYFVKSIM